MSAATRMHEGKLTQLAQKKPREVNKPGVILLAVNCASRRSSHRIKRWSVVKQAKYKAAGRYDIFPAFPRVRRTRL